jgi:hypothetical protein
MHSKGIQDSTPVNTCALWSGSVNHDKDRKALKREYKQSQRPMGIFRVRNSVRDRSFIGSTVDLPAMLNRQRAQLSMGVHANRALQQDWNELGSEAFEFDVLDELAPRDQPNYDPTADLQALEELWLDRLSPYEERGYNKAPKCGR